MTGMRKTLKATLSEARAQVEAALKEEGVGILTEINMAATLKARLGLERPPYLILGARNPRLAAKALEAEPEIGLLLPCDVAVREESDGRLGVAFMDPVAVLQMTGHPADARVAHEVRGRLERVKASLIRSAVDGAAG